MTAATDVVWRVTVVLGTVVGVGLKARVGPPDEPAFA